MHYKIIDKNIHRYIECDSAESPLRTEQDALDVIAVCWEHNISLLMLHSGMLTDDFSNLRTGLAGQILQKFVNYQIKTAAVITNENEIQGRFKELLAESNKGNAFRVFSSTIDAENWLLEG